MGVQTDKSITFILSTGRTGTQFFSRYLTETCDRLLCLHEPRPSRRYKWYSNFYLNGKISGGFIAKQYLQTRRSILRDNSYDKYIESSNFIYGCMEPISTVAPDLSVLHIIRDPITYSQSHLNKGFWKGIKKFTAKNIPGWLEHIDPKVGRSNDPVWILLARWIYVNRVILSYQDHYSYMNVRFEDIFSRQAKDPVGQLNRVREFIGFEPLPDEVNAGWLKRASNISKKNLADKWPITEKHLDYLHKNADDLLKRFNYSTGL